MTYTNGELDDNDDDGIYCERVDGEVLCMKFSEYLEKGFVLSEAIPLKEISDHPKGH
jgi:hypothetical protein